MGGQLARSQARPCSSCLDGRIARALKGTSRFAAELDSLADFVDFGVAPALVLYVADLHAAKNFGWVAALLFAMACALRLAQFNVMIDEDQPAWRKTFFVGMPAPAGAIVGLLPIYLHYAFDLGPPTPGSAVVESLYVLGVALLLASRVPHFSGKSLGRVPREYVAVVLVGSPPRYYSCSIFRCRRWSPSPLPIWPRSRSRSGAIGRSTARRNRGHIGRIIRSCAENYSGIIGQRRRERRHGHRPCRWVLFRRFPDWRLDVNERVPFPDWNTRARFSRRVHCRGGDCARA